MSSIKDLNLYDDRDRKISGFDSEDSDSIKNIFNFLNDNKDVKFIKIKIGERKIKESVIENVPNKEYTIWSSSDLEDNDKQIPLIKVIVNDEGELEAVALSDDAFDQESYRTATSSLKATKGKPTKDRLIRIDKSLNHSDPNLSTEIQRYLIRANKNNSRKTIPQLLKGKRGYEIPDEGTVTPDNKHNYYGLKAIANQTLISIRDELKATANLKTTDEDRLVNLFEELTGVNYYTEDISNEDQYSYVLDLMGKSGDKFDESYDSPKENMYIQNLKDLTEDLIEKVNLRNDPDFYKL